jgi:hypothetical protein
MPKFGSGRKHILTVKETKQLKQYTSDPRFKARMAQINSIPVNNKFDIPYLCGYAKDASKIYFDRHFNPKFNGKDITKFLKIHEVSEKALIDFFDLHYDKAHKFATNLEREAVRAAGLDWQKYTNHLDPYIKQVEHEHIDKVPKDLDLIPYKDEHDTRIFKQLLAKEKKPLHETKISLEYHDELNPKLWDGARLKPEVRQALIKFGNAWASYAKIPQSLIMDMIMTGGNANYNYTPKSDIDVHLVIDRNALGSNREFVDEYLQDKKVLWTLTHKISILGYSLEPYAQDNSDRYPANQGVYSLQRDRWIQYPNKGNYDFQNDPGLKRKVLFYKKMIDQIISEKMNMSSVKELKSKLRTMRAASIAAGGEFSFENLVFKELRNRGYLDKLNKYEQMLKDKELSL